MELSDIGIGIMLAQAGLATGMAQNAARRSQAQADDNHIAAAIYAASSCAHADGNANLYRRLLASDLEVERLEGKVDDLVHQRSEILRECQILLDEVTMLRARDH